MLEKSLLERFINKYSIGGAIESVTITAETGKGISTKCISDDKTAVGMVTCTKIDIEDGDYGIYNTAQLRSLLGVLGGELKIKVIKTGTKVTGLLFSDETSKVTFVLTDKQNIPSAPTAIKQKTYEVIVKIDDKFLTTFVKGKNALPDEDTFTFITDGKKSDVVIGYSKINTNRVSIPVETDLVDKIDPISFSARYLRDILVANKEMTKGTMSISTSGLAHINFEIEGFELDYYLVKIDRKD